MTNPTLQFWYEFGSTYTYLSVARIEALAHVASVSLVWKPFLLMPVLKHLGAGPTPVFHVCRDDLDLTRSHELGLFNRAPRLSAYRS